MSRSAATHADPLAEQSLRRRERLETRLSPGQKQLLERAAALKGLSLTGFVLESAQAAALETIRQHEVVELTARDSLAFAQALLNPPAPNHQLRNAARHHRDLIVEE